MERQPIQKLGVARLLAYAAEVFQGFDNARSEEFFPIAVDGNPRSQWLTRQKEPLRQSEPVAWRAGRKLGENSGHIGRKVRTYLGEEIAALEFQCCPSLIGLLLRHHRKRDGGDLVQLPIELLETGNILRADRITA